jgi:hypothetical protein
MGYKLMRRIEQPCMENGVQVYAPGDLLEMDAPIELGGRVVVTETPDAPPAVVAAEAKATSTGTAAAAAKTAPAK